MSMRPVDRVLLLMAGLLAGYQVAVGIDDFALVPVLAYTAAFGILLVTGLLLIILGFEILDSPVVAVLSTIIPLSLSLGLIWQYLPAYRMAYLVFTGFGLAAAVLTRAVSLLPRVPSLVLALVHGTAGLVILLLPFWLSLQGTVGPFFSLVSLGGALIGIGGILLAFLKQGRPLLSRQQIYQALPGLLFLTTLCFTAGFKFA
jgi:hypothetical protein